MNGIILIDKPQGWTSHDVVAKLRGILSEKRIGHSGTLDPMATGLLVVFLGRATRAVQFAEAHHKEYLASLRLGVETDSQDVTGSVLRRCDNIPAQGALKAILPDFTGEILQIPPMYSAVKVQGKKLYELARKGEQIERAPRQISIERLELTGVSRQGDYELVVRCSKGTYIRTLCHDMGAALGCGGALSALRRTRAGDFRVEDAYTLEQVSAAAQAGTAQGLLLPVDTLFQSRPSLVLDENQKKRCLCGNSFLADASDGEYRVYDRDGEFLMLGEAKNGQMSTVKSFFQV